jgi:hypothetical protein
MQQWQANTKTVRIIAMHDEHDECDFKSMCCGAGAVESTLNIGTYGTTGFCKACHEATGFECDLCRCPECDRIVRDEDGGISARVQAGMKCGLCAY